MRIPFLFRTVCVASLLGAGLLAASVQAGDTSPPAPLRAQELVHIVRQDCGSCHGLQLAGGLGPALTPELLADKPVDSLVATVISGRPGTPMPPFRGIITEAEAEWIVAQLLQGFPADAGLPPAR